MQFNSYIFIMAFMPIMILSYFLLGRVDQYWSKIVLIVGSIVFYAYTDIHVLKVLGISLIINFLFAKLIEKCRWKKLYMAVPVVINVGILLYFKYTDFAITNFNLWCEKDIKLKKLYLPLGISFFTFQQIAYIVAVYKKEIASVKPVDYLAYILYFPKLVMGPLMEPSDFLEQINDTKRRRVDWDNIAAGVRIFSFGLLKKVLLADTFAKAVSWAFTNIETATSMDWMLAMLFYTFEIYFDFSGYSDMAVGSSLMLNITLPINFDSPYKAVSVRDLWKRWHISLTSFLTKYIYIPLGGNRRGLFFTCLNTMIVFLISGVWHGANWTFILWGALHGLFCVFDRLIEKTSIEIFKPMRWLATFFVVSVLWLLFRADSVRQWLLILKIMFSFGDTTASSDLLNVFCVQELSALIDTVPVIASLHEKIRGLSMVVFILAASLICFIPENNYRRMKKLSAVGMVFAAIAMIWGITCLGNESVFVYFNF